MESLFSVTGVGAEPAPVCVITLPGPPVPKGRPRFRYVKPKNPAKLGFVTVYSDKATVAFETALKWKGKAAMKGRPPFDGPLAVRIFAMIPIPKSWSGKKRDAALTGQLLASSRPDFDNYAKAACDGLNGMCWVDDAQIVRALVVKEYAENPGLIIEIYMLP